MSFITEYFDEYRKHPIHKREPCWPNKRYTKLPGQWLDPHTSSTGDKMTDEEKKQFIKRVTREMRSQSNYYNTHCAHLDQIFKTRPHVPRPKKRPKCKEEAKEAQAGSEIKLLDTGGRIAFKDSELIKMAHELYTQDLNKPSLAPLDTSARILSYVRPTLYHTGISEYQGTFSKLAYEMVRDDRIPRYVAENGNRPRWGIPPEEERQPMLDGIPFYGESLLTKIP